MLYTTPEKPTLIFMRLCSIQFWNSVNIDAYTFMGREMSKKAPSMVADNVTYTSLIMKSINTQLVNRLFQFISTYKTIHF